MKKKVLSILLAATFTVSMFAGCGNSNTTAKDDNAAKTEGTADDAAEEEPKMTPQQRTQQATVTSTLL